MDLCPLRLLVRLLQLGNFFIHLGLVLVLLLLQPLLDLHVELNLFFCSVVDLSPLILLLEARYAHAEMLFEVLDFIKLLLIDFLNVGLLAEEVLLRHGRHKEEILSRAAVGGAANTASQGRGCRAHRGCRVEALVLHDRGRLQDDVLATLPADCLDLEAALQILLIDLCQNRLLLLLVRGHWRL